MKNKIIGIVICTLLICSSTTLAVPPFSNDTQQTKHQFFDTTPFPKPSMKTNEISSKTTFTHTIFCELQAASWCPDCPTAVTALSNIYKSNDYQLYYTTLIYDKNPNAKHRIHQYKSNLLIGYIAFPTVYFDGGYKNKVGNTSVNATAAAYREIIDEVGNRSVTAPIELSSEVIWLGGGKITVTLTIKNNGDKPYLGKIRSYITEIISRWKDSKGIPFDFGFLDFAINKLIFISAGETKNISEQWDATQSHGQNFGNVSKDNIMVISTISDWIPHYRTGFIYKGTMQKYFAYYVDQTTATTPVSL